jgi:signal recognition particle receptor subunit beta
MKTLRLVVTGTVGAGKSTFVRTASESEVVDTERTATDETSLMKAKTTVAFDFGQLTFGRHMALRVYGTPGQSRFDFMWDILIRGAHAYILLVAADRPSGFREAREILAFMNQRVQIPMIIGVTHRDCPGAWSADHILMTLGYMNDKHRPPVITVNPLDKTSVLEALIVAMALQIAKSGNAQNLRFGEPSQPTQPQVKLAEPSQPTQPRAKSSYQWPKIQSSQR